MSGFADLLDEFCAAVAAGDGARFAALFTEDGEYDDVFYGLHKGRAAIGAMLEGMFHRDGRDFCWQMIRAPAPAAWRTSPAWWSTIASRGVMPVVWMRAQRTTLVIAVTRTARPGRARAA